jgi:PhoPQ-activated pathogenicity-related protein
MIISNNEAFKVFRMTRLLPFLITALVSLSTLSSASAEGLADYVASTGRPSDISILDRLGSEPVRVSFQSQVWRGVPWRHELLIKHPHVLGRHDIVAILLTGGDGGESQQRNAQKFADELGIRVAVLTKVPNQPLFGGKTEDVLLSYTLDRYRQSGDASWPLLFPMVTSVVRGIDTLQESLQQPHLRVMLIGASKRGWTTYLSAAVERRIIGIVPAVYEMIAMREQVALARDRYGKDSEKIRPYTALGLTDALLEPRMATLLSWIDPVGYFPRLTIPKLVLLGANDPYWVVDSVREYWDKLPEPKMLRILPNVGHGVLGEATAADAIISFARVVMSNDKLPSATWRFSGVADGVAMVTGAGAESLTRCTVWRATSADADFRDSVFAASACDIAKDGRGFKSIFAVPPRESTAVFADLETVGGGRTILLSTESQVYLRNMSPQAK